MDTMMESPDLFLLTAQAPSGIAVLSLQGPGADRILSARFRASRGMPRAGRADLPRAGRADLPRAGRAVHGFLLDQDQPLDEVLILCVDNNRPAYEICSHGGAGVSNAIVSALTKAGARARPWSDLVKPRTLAHDLLTALFQSRGRRQAALLAFQGHGGLRKILCRLLDCLHAGTRREKTAASGAAQEALALLEELEESYRIGRFLCRPPKVVLSGPPNAGKSTLFNALLGDQRALTSKIPGTTLDPVEAFFLLDGFPIHLFDLPGAPKSVDSIPVGEAQERAGLLVRDADCVLDLVGLPLEQENDLSGVSTDEAPGSASHILVLNKADRIPPDQHDLMARTLNDRTHKQLMISALRGTGLKALFAEISQVLGLSILGRGFKPYLFNSGQESLIREFREILEKSEDTARIADQVTAYLSVDNDPLCLDFENRIA